MMGYQTGETGETDCRECHPVIDAMARYELLSLRLPAVRKYKRGSFKLVSFASEPELSKNAFHMHFPGDNSINRSAERLADSLDAPNILCAK
jgi:hypothetical protein